MDLYTDIETPPEQTLPESTTTTMSAATTTTTPVVDDEPMHVDPAEKVYDTMKSVWTWGKGVVIFSPFLGMAEAVAGKVVETAGSSLEGVDSGVTGKLQEWDDGLFNPVIHVVVQTVLKAASKTEGIVKPIVLTMFKPLDYFLKSHPENNNSEELSPESAAPPPPAMN